MDAIEKAKALAAKFAAQAQQSGAVDEAPDTNISSLQDNYGRKRPYEDENGDQSRKRHGLGSEEQKQSFDHHQHSSRQIGSFTKEIEVPQRMVKFIFKRYFEILKLNFLLGWTYYRKRRRNFKEYIKSYKCKD
jgi:hypothetical protein